MSSNPQTPQKSRPSLASLLEITIQNWGMREWTRIAHEKAHQPFSDPYLIPSRKEFLGRLRIETQMFSQFAKTLRLKDWLSLLPTGLGFSCSWWVPHTDFKFILKNDPSRQLFLHRPFLLYTEIFIRWWKVILTKVQEHRDLNDREREWLHSALDNLQLFEKGFQSGTYRKDLAIKLFQSFSLIHQRGHIRFRLEPSFFNWLQNQFVKD